MPDMKTKKRKPDTNLLMAKTKKAKALSVKPVNIPAVHNGPIDKILHGLTDLKFNMDLKLTRTGVDTQALKKVKVSVKPYTYTKELGKQEYILYGLSTTNRKIYPKYHGMPHAAKEKLIALKDGFARGVSKYINEKYKQEYKITNAFIKLWEIYNTFDWLIPKDRTDTKMFHMTEAPGQWINTTNTFFKQHMPETATYDWYANSLNPDHPKIKGIISALKNEYGIIKKYKERWIWGADDTGDITVPENIRWYGKYIAEKFGSVNVVTGDAGLNIGEFNLEFLQKLEFAQMVMVACTSTPGSSCVIKHFLPYLTTHKESKQASGFFMSFMYMYQLMFKEFHMFKPLSSSPGSGEFYFVANGFLGLPEEVKNILLDALGNFKLNHAIFERRDIPSWFVNKVCGFINGLMQRNIDNDTAELELLKCMTKKPSKVDCEYYFGPKFRLVKEQDLEGWITKYKLNVRK